MIRPSVKCTIERTAGYDVYGKPALSAPMTTRCSVVRLSSESIKTSVRADSSATRGAARETEMIARLLFLPSVGISVGDRVTVSGLSLKVAGVQPRFNIQGRLDHNQVELSAWA